MNEAPPPTETGTSRRLAWSAGLAAVTLLVAAALLLLLYRPEVPPPPTIERDDMAWAQEVERENSTGHESAQAVVATGNSFSVVGHTNSRSPGVQQTWVLRFDEAPLPRWERTYGGKLGTQGRAIASLPGGGLAVAGDQQVAPVKFQAWLLALSPDGSVAWERALGSEGLNELKALTVLEDGSIVAGGIQDGAGWVVRLDERGEVLWEVKLPQLERVTALCALPAKRIAVVGTAEWSTTGLGISRLLLLEPDGRTTQERRLPAEGRGELAALSLLPDGGLIATGRRSPPGSMDWNLWVVRLDASGETLWERFQKEPVVEAGNALTSVADNGIAVVGYTLKDMVDRETKVWRFAANGDLLWQQSYGGAGDDLGYGIAHLADGSLVVVGSTTSRGAGKTDLWTFRLSAEGKLLWEEMFGGP